MHHPNLKNRQQIFVIQQNLIFLILFDATTYFFYCPKLAPPTVKRGVPGRIAFMVVPLERAQAAPTQSLEGHECGVVWHQVLALHYAQGSVDLLVSLVPLPGEANVLVHYWLLALQRELLIGLSRLAG